MKCMERRRTMNLNHPHHVRQSMSDWDIEHQECIGHALDEGIDNFDAMLSFAEAQMSHVDTPHLKQLWEKLKGEL